MPRTHSQDWNPGDDTEAERLQDFNEDIDDIYELGTDRGRIVEAASGTPLKIDIGAFAFRVGSTHGVYAGGSDIDVQDDDTNYVEIDSTGTIQINQSTWVDANARLGIVETAGGVITDIILYKSDVIGGVLGGAAAGDAALFGTGVDGDVTLGSNITLTRDMHYRNLDLSTFTLNTGGFKVFVSDTLSGSGKIKAPTGGNGGNGGNASGTTGSTSGGSAGAAAAGGTLPDSKAGYAGGSGANGKLSTGTTQATAGSSENNSNSLGTTSGSAGGTGGGGGRWDTGTGSNNSGGAGGTATAHGKYLPQVYSQFASNKGTTWSQITGSGRTGQSTGGGGGDCINNFGTGGGGGAAGGTGGEGGYWFIAARNITGTWNIESLGGNGGNGGNGGSGTSGGQAYGGGGGGAGGSGGSGGSGVLMYQNSTWTGNYVLTGGSAGTGGSGGSGGNGGSNGAAGGSGNAGAAGTALEVQIA